MKMAVEFYPPRSRNFAGESSILENEEAFFSRKHYEAPILRFIPGFDDVNNKEFELLILAVGEQASNMMRLFPRFNSSKHYIGSLDLPEIPIKGILDPHRAGSGGCQIYAISTDDENSSSKETNSGSAAAAAAAGAAGAGGAASVAVALAGGPAVGARRAAAWARALAEGVPARRLLVLDTPSGEARVPRPFSLLTSAFRSSSAAAAAAAVEAACPPLAPPRAPLALAPAAAAALSRAERRGRPAAALLLQAGGLSAFASGPLPALLGAVLRLPLPAAAAAAAAAGEERKRGRQGEEEGGGGEEEAAAAGWALLGELDAAAAVESGMAWGVAAAEDTNIYL